jgi:hypothetical protein
MGPARGLPTPARLTLITSLLAWLPAAPGLAAPVAVVGYSWFGSDGGAAWVRMVKSSEIGTWEEDRGLVGIVFGGGQRSGLPRRRRVSRRNDPVDANWLDQTDTWTVVPYPTFELGLGLGFLNDPSPSGLPGLRLSVEPGVIYHRFEAHPGLALEIKVGACSEDPSGVWLHPMGRKAR